MNKRELKDYFDSQAGKRDAWYKRNSFYHGQIARLMKRFIPEGSSVLEIGCATGNLLDALKPKRGVGIDFSSRMIAIAQKKFPRLCFQVQEAESFSLDEQFDFIVLSDVIGLMPDIWQVFRRVRAVCGPQTQVIINSFNFLWYLPLRLAERLRLKMASCQNNWLSTRDIANLLELSGFEVFAVGSIMPFSRHLGVSVYLAARPAGLPCRLPAGRQGRQVREPSCSVVIPTRNEAGNIADCVKRMPKFCKDLELIFVDGDSTDGTPELIQKLIDDPQRRFPIKLVRQLAAPSERGSAKMLRAGKGDAVRKGFDAATGEILMILDSDLTVAPEDLPKFYLALAEKRAGLVNGCRLVYPLEKDSMRFLNLLANKFFGLVFSWLIGQPIKDTLCGTKALYKDQYLKIKANRAYFGDFDPFGDFDLLFGAARLGLVIKDMPVRYWPRVWGRIKVERFRHGLLLLKMSWIGFKKLKLKIAG